MELRRYIDVLMRRRLLVLAVLAGALGAAVAATLLLPERWRATATVSVEPASALEGGAVRADDITYLDRLVNTYGHMAESRPVAERVARRLKLPGPPALDVEDVPGTNLMEIRATTASRHTAAAAADAAAALLISGVRSGEAAASRSAAADFRRRARALEERIASAEMTREALEFKGMRGPRALRLAEEVRGKRLQLSAQRAAFQSFQSARDARANAVSLAARSAPPSRPINRDLRLALALGLLVGLIAAPGAAFVAENLSRRLRTGDEIEDCVHAPVLASIPDVHGTPGAAIFNSGSEAEQAFRRLRTTLLLPPYENLRTILVASAEHGDGRSTVVANLGRSLAQAGRTVIVVDADLRAPTLHRFFGKRNGRGLGEALAESASPADALASCQSTSVTRLSLLSAGRPVDDAATLLGADAAGELLLDLEQHFAFVLIDSPALLTAPDALAVARHADGVVLVAGPQSKRDALDLATRELVRGGAPPVGVIVNRAERRPRFAGPARRPEPAEASP